MVGWVRRGTSQGWSGVATEIWSEVSTEPLQRRIRLTVYCLHVFGTLSHQSSLPPFSPSVLSLRKVLHFTSASGASGLHLEVPLLYPSLSFSLDERYPRMSKEGRDLEQVWEPDPFMISHDVDVLNLHIDQRLRTVPLPVNDCNLCSCHHRDLQ